VPIDPGQAYYYAGGERRRLVGSDLVAVDLEALGDVDEGAAEELRSEGQALTGGIVLVASEVAAKVLGDRLKDCPGVHPVYEADGALVVVLPEVRVEGGAEALRRAEKSASARASVEAGEGRLVLRPRSGRGEEALELANEIAESASSEDLELAQARFVRVTARPDTHR
jgi:hypothetical protein